MPCLNALKHLMCYLLDFAAIERGIANACEALIGFNFERDEIAARAANNDACGGDFHENSC